MGILLYTLIGEFDDQTRKCLLNYCVGTPMNKTSGKQKWRVSLSKWMKPIDGKQK